jgi:uncharacterized DUF497 family protein
MDFVWDEDKAATNLRKHGVSFEFAALVFKDPLAIEKFDDREDYGEDRIICVGRARDGDCEKLLSVVYTDRDEARRLISARQAVKHEKDEYYCENAL